ncbi:MAG: YicC/YloC family endoribonuclease [Planctomycetota bacterium]
MLRSMTGYGEAQVKLEDLRVTAVVKSVNNKGFKFNTAYPDEIKELSLELEKLALRFLSRGSIYLQIECENISQPQFSVNKEILSSYYSELTELRKKLGLNPEVNFELLALLPGSVNDTEWNRRNSKYITLPKKKNHRTSIKKLLTTAVLSASEKALKELNRSREKEGLEIKKDISEKLKYIIKSLSVLERRQKNFLEVHSGKLAERVKKLLAASSIQVTQSDVAREAAIIAERSDLNEEIQRMRAHIQQLHAALKSHSPVGRRIDFIAQEMFREANTIASKSVDPELVVHILDLKLYVDKIREQSQNVE